MADYKMIPVDVETYARLKELCQAYELGERSQGAMVRKLVKAEHEKLAEVKLIGAAKSSERKSAKMENRSHE